MRASATPVRVVWRLLVALALVMLLGGCKVDARVDVTLRADGSGEIAARIALDADAVTRLTRHAPLATAVPVGDLRAAGWKVSAWSRDKSGGGAMLFTHDFVGQADLERRVADLAGREGVLRDPLITRTRGWFGAKDAISIDVDLNDVSAGVRSDAQLAARLKAAGLDVDALDAQLRSQLRKALTVTVAVREPGGHSRTVELAAGDHATVEAARSQTYTRRIVLLVVGGALLLGALALTGASRASRSRPRRAS